MDRRKLRLSKYVNIGDFVKKGRTGWFHKVSRDQAEYLVTEDGLVDMESYVNDYMIKQKNIRIENDLIARRNLVFFGALVSVLVALAVLSWLSLGFAQ